MQLQRERVTSTQCLESIVCLLAFLSQVYRHIVIIEKLLSPFKTILTTCINVYNTYICLSMMIIRYDTKHTFRPNPVFSLSSTQYPLLPFLIFLRLRFRFFLLFMLILCQVRLRLGLPRRIGAAWLEPHEKQKYEKTHTTPPYLRK